MLTRIPNITEVQARHIENTDTRKDIQHEDPVFERRRKKGHAEDHAYAAIDDVAEVSVEALIAFIDMELRQYDAAATVATSSEETEDAPAEKQTSEPPADPAALAAARAYGGKSLPALQPRPQAEAVPGGLDSEGQRLLQSHLMKLRALREKGVAALTIRRGGTFLDALGEAIAEAHI